MSPETAGLPVHLAERERPFWGFAEILVVAAVFLVGALAAGTLVKTVGPSLHLNPELGLAQLLVEFAAYGLVFAALKILFARYGEPLFESLGWVSHNLKPLHLAVTGVILAAVVVMLGNLLQFPNVETPFDKLLNDRASRFAIAAFGVSLGPIIEELLFRGFLQPVLVNAFGVLYGILATSLVFGALHLTQNAGVWQSGALITLVGFVLGVIRHLSGSTKASSVAHIGYNALPFVVLLVSGKP